MTQEEPTPSEYLPGKIYSIGDVGTLRLLADPLRLRLFELVRREPHTVKELAKALGVNQTKLYYHVNLLVELGLLRIAATRLVSGIVEKRYEATATRLSLDRSLFRADEPTNVAALETLLAVILEQAKTEIRRSVSAGLVDASSKNPATGGLILGRAWYRLTPELLGRFMARLGEIEDEFARSSRELPETTEANEFEFLVGLYPVIHSESRDESDS